MFIVLRGLAIHVDLPLVDGGRELTLLISSLIPRPRKEKWLLVNRVDYILFIIMNPRHKLNKIIINCK